MTMSDNSNLTGAQGAYGDDWYQIDSYILDTSTTATANLIIGNGTFNAYSTFSGNLTLNSTFNVSDPWISSSNIYNGSSYVPDRADVKIAGKSLKDFMSAVEKRLAILEEPSPEKLERFAALKKAYEHYKTLEALIGDD